MSDLMPKVAAGVFVLAMAAANLLIVHFGPWFSPVNAFVLVGLSMVTRDLVHEAWWDRGNFALRMGAMIAAGGVLAYAVNPAAGRIAIASSLALVASASVETLVFSRLSHRRWLVRSNGSNLPGAVVDTVVFVGVAFGLSAGMVALMAVQATTKTVGGGVWSVLLAPWRRGHVAARNEG